MSKVCVGVGVGVGVGLCMDLYVCDVIVNVVVGVFGAEGVVEEPFFAISKTIAKIWRCYKSVVKYKE